MLIYVDFSKTSMLQIAEILSIVYDSSTNLMSMLFTSYCFFSIYFFFLSLAYFLSYLKLLGRLVLFEDCRVIQCMFVCVFFF